MTPGLLALDDTGADAPVEPPRVLDVRALDGATPQENSP